MLRTAHTSLPVLVAIVIVLATPGDDLRAQSSRYELVDGWAKLPPGMDWGQVISVDPDAHGHIYAFHRAEPPILKFDGSGRLAGSFGQNMFVWAHGLHIDRDGFIWATDAQARDGKGQQVFKFRPDGTVVLTLGRKGVAGDGPDTFNGPTDVAVAANGDIFVTDGHVNNRVVKFSKAGAFLKAWGRKGTGPGEFDLPHTIAIDSQGRLLVGDRSNQRIQIFDQEGRFLEEWRQFGMPSGIFIDGNDTIYVADYQLKKGLLIGSARDGSVKGFIDGTLSEGIAADEAGNVYAGEVAGRMLKRFAKR